MISSRKMCVFLFLVEKVAHLPTVFVILKNLTVLQNTDQWENTIFLTCIFFLIILYYKSIAPFY